MRETLIHRRGRCPFYGTTELMLGKWYHIAFVRSGNNFQLFVNGILQGTVSWSGTIYINSANVMVGANPTPSEFLNGSIDDLRITKGVARYISTTVPLVEIPSAPLPYGSSDTYWSNVSLFSNFDPTDYFVDSSAWHPFTSKGYAVLSSDQSKFGAKSAYFGGTGVITTPHKDDLHLPGDFTIEGWIYPTVTNVDQWILTKAEAFGGSYPPYTIKMLSAGTIQFLAYSADNSGNGIVSATFGTPTGNAWNHFAVVRFKDKWYGYLNGVGTLLATTATNPYNNTTNGLAIGGDWIGYQGRGFTGYIDEVRIIKGVAKYQADFSVPTKEFDFTGFGDSIGMQYPGFHCHFNGTSFVDERGAAITANGNAAISITQSKFGGTSGYFDGSGDYLISPTSTSLGFGTGDFTIEAWIYPVSINNDSSIVDMRSAYSLGNGTFFIDYLSGGKIAFYDGATKYGASGTAISTGSWTHVAITRKGTNLNLFVNGNIDASGTMATDLGSSRPLGIGGSPYSGDLGGAPFNGYIDELRITKGFARYTRNFTPANSPFSHSSGDPHWDQVVWAFPLIGPNGSTAFYDKGPVLNAITNSNVIYASTDIRRFGNSQGTAASFNGTSARLTFTPNGRPFNAQFDWTVEGWLYSTASGAGRGILCIDGVTSSYYGHYFFKTTTNKLAVNLMKLSAPTTAFNLVGSTTVTDSTWHHFAFTKRGKTVRIFLDGGLDGTWYLTEEVVPPIASTNATIGAYHTPSEYWSGYLQDIRVTNVCKYISSFTPPQMPLGFYRGQPSLVCNFEGSDDGTTFIDEIGNQLTANGSAVTSIDAYKFGTSSGYFTGSSDYITVSNGLSNFNWGDGDFTIDCWVKTASNSGDIGYIYNQQQTGAAIWLRFGDASVNHALQACVGDTTLDILTTTLTKTDFSSNFRHIQLCKRYRSFVLYVDGVSIGNKEMVYDFNQKSTTLLLLHCNGTNGSTTFTDSSPFARAVTANGNAQISTAQSKFGGASALFDGTGDYLSLTYSNSFAFPFVDWTLECWFRITAYDLTNGNALISISGAAGSRMIELVTLPSGTYEVTRIMVTSDGTDMFNLSGNTALQLNTWYHIACVRYRNQITLYLNGAVEASLPYSSNLYGSPTSITIGRYTANTGADITGNIDEVRISSVARYAAAFTPQVAAFDETITDTELFTTPSSVQIGGLNGYIDALQIWNGDLPITRYYQVPTERIPANSPTIVDTGLDLQSTVINRGVKPIGPGKVGSVSGYFDGIQSYLAYKHSYDDWIYSSDFTIELWYMTFDLAPTNHRGIVSYRYTGGYSPFILRRESSSGAIAFYYQTGSGTYSSAISATIPIPFTWYHIALVRENGTIQLFINGVSEASASRATFNQTQAAAQTGMLYIGVDLFGTAAHLPHYGYIDSFQFIKGFAKYSRNFIPPSVPSVEPVDFYAYLIKRFAPIVFYKMDDAVTATLSDANGNSPLTIDSPSNITIQQPALNPLDISNFEYSVLFDGGKGTGSLLREIDTQAGITLVFFIKTTATTGTIVDKNSTFVLSLNQGKLAVSSYYNSGTYQIESPSAINDGVSHLVMISLSDIELKMNIDGVDVVSTYFNASSTNNLVEMPFNYADTNTIFQLRAGETDCDLMKNLMAYDDTPLIVDNGPFGKSIAFVGRNHLEVPFFNLSSVKNLAVALARNTLNFTIEFWILVNQTPAATMQILSMGCSGSGTGTTANLRGGLVLEITTSRKLEIRAGNLNVGGATTWFYKQTPNAIALNTWTHFAVTVYANDLNIFQDGVLQSLSYTDSANYPHGSLVNSQIYTSDFMNIGSHGYNRGGLSGGAGSSVSTKYYNLADIRISRGVLYSGNFTRPSSALVALTEAPLLSLVPNSAQPFGNLIVDMGSKKINKTQLKLNGTSDYLIVADNDMMIGTFTIDLWVWFKTVSVEQAIVSQSEASLSVKNQKLALTDGTEEVGTTTLTTNTWHHIAIVRSGTTAKVYLDGILEITHAAFNDPSRGQMQVGAKAGASFLNGLIDAVRVRSSEVWTGNFTPPVMIDYIPDPYWDDNVLLIRSDTPTILGDSLSQNTAFQYRFTGYSGTARGTSYDDVGNYGMTFVGNANVVASNFRGYLNNISFDGVNDAIVVPNTTGIRLGTTFTLEGWVFIIDFNSKRTLFDKREDTTSGFYLYLDTDAKFYLKAGDTTPGWDVEITSAAVSVGWRHIAIVRNAANSNSWMLFIDGTQAGSTVNSSITVADNTDLRIGKNKDGAEYFYGGITEIIYTTTAKYTGAFTYPTTAAPDPMAYENDQTLLLMHFDGANGSETFLDSSRYNWKAVTSYGTKLSSTQSKFGGTSVYFDGTAGRGVIVEPSPVFNLKEEDFTIDFWAYIAATGTTRQIVGQWCQGLTSMSVDMWLIQQTSSNYIVFYWSPYSGASALLTSASTFTANQWVHIAVTKKDDLFTLFINGAISATASTPRSVLKGSVLRGDRVNNYGITFGDYYDNSSPPKYVTSTATFSGYIDEFRLVKGKAMWDSAFMAPTSAYSLSANYPVRDSNVKLFIDSSVSGQIIDKTFNNVPTLEGGIFAGTIRGTVYGNFDGNGDAIRLTSVAGDVVAGLDDFCIESWVYPINGGYVAQAYGRIFETEQYGTSGGIYVTMNNSGTTSPCAVRIDDSRTGGNEFHADTSVTIPNATWSHVAFTRSGTRTTSWLNGVPKQITYTEACFTSDRSDGTFTLSNNNKTVTNDKASSWKTIVSRSYFDIATSVGIYWEGICTAVSYELWGIVPLSFTGYTGYPGSNGASLGSYGYRSTNGSKYFNAVATAYGNTFTVNDVIGIAVKNGKIWFAKNGVWQASGNPVTEANPAFSGLTGLFSAAIGRYNATSTHTIRTMHSEFTYAPPAGFISLRDSDLGYNVTKNKISMGANNSALESFYGNLSNTRFTSGNTRYSQSWSAKTLSGDPNSASVVLLLNLNTDFTDSSNSAKTVTSNSVTIDSSIKRFGAGSAYFSGSTTYLSIGDSNDWNFGTGDFTIEMWVKSNNYPFGAYNDTTNARWLLNQRSNASNYIAFNLTKTGATFEVMSAASQLIKLDSTTYTNILDWHHYVIQRYGNVFSIYIDGISVASTTLSITMPDISAPLEIGRWSGGGGYFSGWIDDIRITKGVARYPAEFSTVQIPIALQPIAQKRIRSLAGGKIQPVQTHTSTGKFDLAIDHKSNDFVSTQYSGTHDLTIDRFYDLTLNYNDFTIEGWFNPSTTGSQRFYYQRGVNTAGGVQVGVSKDNLDFRFPSAITQNVSVNITTWAHVVFQRKGTLKQIFLNGVKVSEVTQAATNISDYDVTTYLGGGGSSSDTFRYYGQVDGFRITRGVARYSSDFTPPTTQFPTKYATPANSRLNLFFDDLNKLPSNVFRIGGALNRASSVNEKGAVFFDGDEDYICLSEVLSREDFTLEFWFEPHIFGSPSYPVHIWNQMNGPTDTTGIGVELVSGYLQLHQATNVTNLIDINLYTWYHFALTRQNGTLRAFVNGVKLYEASVPAFSSGFQALGIVVDDGASPNEFRYKGYIKNYRLIKNVAQYISNFTPASTLSTYSETVNKLNDTNRSITIGDFVGNLDNVGLLLGVYSQSMAQDLYDISQKTIWSPTRDYQVEKTITQQKNHLSHSGNGSIWGVVTDASGNPMERRIILVEYWTYMVVDETISDPITGYYEFADLDTFTPYSVVAEDYLDYRYNDIIRGKIHAEVK